MTPTDEQIAEAQDIKLIETGFSYWATTLNRVAARLALGRIKQRLSALRAAQERIKNLESGGTCEWRESEYCWESSCGLEWVLEDDSPIANGMMFCPRCGKKLIEAESAKEEER